MIDPISGKKAIYDYLVEQIMPAPEWRVRTCEFHDGRPYVREVPVIGWAVITRAYDTDEIDRSVTLICAGGISDGAAYSRTVDDLSSNGETGVQVIPPGVEENDAKLAKETRSGLEIDLENLADDDGAREAYDFLSQNRRLTPFRTWRELQINSLRKMLGLPQSKPKKTSEIPAAA